MTRHNENEQVHCALKDCRSLGSSVQRNYKPGQQRYGAAFYVEAFRSEAGEFTKGL